MQARFLQIRMSPELYEAVSVAAWRRRLSVAAFCRELFETYVEAAGITAGSACALPECLPGFGAGADAGEILGACAPSKMEG